MKNITLCLLAFATITSSAMASTCVALQLTKSEQKHNYVNKLCGKIEKAEINGDQYRISNLIQVVGSGMIWGVPSFRSKNKICREILGKAGISENARYVSGSLVLGDYDTDMPVRSIREIRCDN